MEASMAEQKAGKVYGSAEEMIAGVSKDTGVAPEQVRKVVHASFASTKDFVLRELARAQAAEQKGAKGQTLSDKDLEQVAGGLVYGGLYSTPGFDFFKQVFQVSPSLAQKLGAITS
jgi:hypothetical protein